MSSKPIIKCIDLWFTYPNGVLALKEINLEIYEGEIVAIIGQNGSGKTTLVKHFNGLLKPTKGRVLVKGVDTRTKPVYELARYVGYVFQNPIHQLCSRTVEEELAFGPRNLGLKPSEVKERVEEAIKLFDLEEYRYVHPYRLPYPLKKLVAIASVYTMKPEVIVLDEPTTGQDHRGLRMVQNAIEKMHREGMTVIFVTHDMRLVAETAKRVIVMYDGRIVADGSPREVFLNDEVLQLTNLHPPQITEFCKKLRKEVPQHDLVALSVEEEVEYLQKLLQKAQST